MSIATFLVDDQPDIRMLLRILIERHAGEMSVIGEAEDGREALAQLEGLHPDVIVVDHMMPGMTGVELARELATRLPDVPVILCTAYLDAEVEAAARDAGVREVLSKNEITRVPDVVRQAAA